jgi:hypothetical protein
MALSSNSVQVRAAGLKAPALIFPELPPENTGEKTLKPDPEAPSQMIPAPPSDLFEYMVAIRAGRIGGQTRHGKAERSAQFRPNYGEIPNLRKRSFIQSHGRRRRAP